MNKCHLNNSRITRWILTIQEYKFDIIHCKGKENIVADTLSRNPEDVMEGETFEDSCEYMMNHIVIKMNREVSKMLREINKYQINDEKLKCIIERIEKDVYKRQV